MLIWQIVITLIFTVFAEFSLIWPVQAAEPVNAGIVSGIWYSEYPFFVGDRITIYVAIQNQEAAVLKGKAIFLDNNTPIGEQGFTLRSQEIVVVSTEWLVTPGKHVITVQLQDVQRCDEQLQCAPASPVISTIGTDTQTVDYDTDGDDIGDSVDTDDDNDGLSDVEEARIGTDPKKADTDGDGLTDFEEVKSGSDPLTAQRFQNTLSDLQKKPHLTTERSSDSRESLPTATVKGPIKNVVESLKQTDKQIREAVGQRIDPDNSYFDISDVPALGILSVLGAIYGLIRTADYIMRKRSAS